VCIDLGEQLLDRIPWDRRALLDDRTPTHVQVPSGPRILVAYTDPAAPVLAVRPQERFGPSETPAVGRGHVSLTHYLRPPAGRPSR
jgi:ATP-dependent helicase HrpB